MLNKMEFFLGFLLRSKRKERTKEKNIHKILSEELKAIGILIKKKQEMKKKLQGKTSKIDAFA